MNSTDPTAPDVEGARRRYPGWEFWQEGRAWLARRADGSAQLDGLSLESLEGKVARAQRARAPGTGHSRAAGSGHSRATGTGQ